MLVLAMIADCTQRVKWIHRSLAVLHKVKRLKSAVGYPGREDRARARGAREGESETDRCLPKRSKRMRGDGGSFILAEIRRVTSILHGDVPGRGTAIGPFRFSRRTLSVWTTGCVLAKRIEANPPPKYSILNPQTNSDSLSIKKATGFSIHLCQNSNRG